MRGAAFEHVQEGHAKIQQGKVPGKGRARGFTERWAQVAKFAHGPRGASRIMEACRAEGPLMSDDYSREQNDRNPARLSRHAESREQPDPEQRTRRLTRESLPRPEDDELAWQVPADSSPLAPPTYRILPQEPLLPALSRRGRIVVTCVLAALALFSILFLGPHFTKPDAYKRTIASLDQKKDTVMTLTGASTGTSAAITLLPGDVATPIAEKLVDISSDFLIVVGALYLEKYLLTLLAFVAFYFMVPLACLLGIAALHHPSHQWRPWLAQMGLRVGVFGIALALVVPVSVAVSGMIENTYRESIEQTVAKAEQTVEDIQESEEAEQAQDQNPLAAIVNTVTEGATDAVERLRDVLNDFIESLAVMIVTSCVIPVVVLVLFVWLIRALFGIDISLPSRITHPRSLTKRDRRRL